jgi:hypothetical protein
MRQCEVDGCTRRHNARGMCTLPYRRWWGKDIDQQAAYAARRQQMIAQKKQHYHANLPLYMWKAARSRARRDGLAFNLEIADIIIPSHCPILGIELQAVHKGESRVCAPSLDRIRPELGYIKGNIAVISMRANRIKNDAGIKELTLVLNWLIENIKEAV